MTAVPEYFAGILLPGGQRNIRAPADSNMTGRADPEQNVPGVRPLSGRAFRPGKPKPAVRP